MIAKNRINKIVLVEFVIIIFIQIALAEHTSQIPLGSFEVCFNTTEEIVITQRNEEKLILKMEMLDVNGFVIDVMIRYNNSTINNDDIKEELKTEAKSFDIPDEKLNPEHIDIDGKSGYRIYGSQSPNTKEWRFLMYELDINTRCFLRFGGLERRENEKGSTRMLATFHIRKK